MIFSHRLILFGLMSAALIFGFVQHLAPASFPYSFERLHIFLFNLCSGGTILIYYSSEAKLFERRFFVFLFFALSYTILAFLELYHLALIAAVCLIMIVERVRITRFSILPFGFFQRKVSIAEKFHQASLLCLSIGLSFSFLVIVNNEYTHWVNLDKLSLNTFFLGFSFPMSLITMSLMFSFMKNHENPTTRLLEQIGFWSINLGVITFFGFIVARFLIGEVIISSFLFAVNIMILFLFLRAGIPKQPKNFLISGLLFLLVTSVTGILYILKYFLPGDLQTYSRFLLSLHAFTALYGWNLSGFAVICRFKDFPIKLNSAGIISLHWLTILILAPIGRYSPMISLAAVLCYIYILYYIFFARAEQPEIVNNSL